MIRIIIADDHALIREGFQKLIEKESDMSVVAECENGPEVLKAIDKTTCDVVILDLKMPGLSGLDLIEQLMRVKLEAKVLVLSMYSEDQFGVRALKAGASGYLTKESAPEELLSAIRKVYGGGRYVSEALGERLAFEVHSDTSRRPHERLSDREFQVLRLIGAGKRAAQIGEELSISVNTVNTYRKRIQEKMGVMTNGEIVRYAVENGLVD